MNAYMYRAALYCEDCIDRIKLELKDSMPDVSDESSFDSDDYPKGPYENGGGEADGPQHCDNCMVFLENPLTAGGYDYVCESVAYFLDYAMQAGVDPSVIREWFNFYNLKVTK